MTIEIHQPELEALIRQRLASGAFHNVEDVLLHALKTSAVPAKDASGAMQSRGGKQTQPGPTGQALIDACAEIRGLLTDEEIDTLFARNRLPSRPVDL